MQCSNSSLQKLWLFSTNRLSMLTLLQCHQTSFEQMAAGALSLCFGGLVVSKGESAWMDSHFRSYLGTSLCRNLLRVHSLSKYPTVLALWQVKSWSLLSRWSRGQILWPPEAGCHICSNQQHWVRPKEARGWEEMDRSQVSLALYTSRIHPSPSWSQHCTLSDNTQEQ